MSVLGVSMRPSSKWEIIKVFFLALSFCFSLGVSLGVKVHLGS